MVSMGHHCLLNVYGCKFEILDNEDFMIRVLRKAWLGEPLHIQVGTTTEIAIRRQETEIIFIRMES